MNSSDLGSAMALSGASDEGSRKACRLIAMAALATSSKFYEAAQNTVPEHRDMVANIASSWRVFADELKAVSR